MKKVLKYASMINNRFLVEQVLSVNTNNQIVYLCMDKSINKKVVVTEFFPSYANRREDMSLTYDMPQDADLNAFSVEHNQRSKFKTFPTVIPSGEFFGANNTYYAVSPWYGGELLTRVTESQKYSFSDNSVRRGIITLVNMEKALSKIGLFQPRLHPENIMIDENGNLRLLEFSPDKSKSEREVVLLIAKLGFYMFTGRYPTDSDSKELNAGSGSNRYVKGLKEIIKSNAANVTLNDILAVVTFDPEKKSAPKKKSTNLIIGAIIGGVLLTSAVAGIIVLPPIINRLKAVSAIEKSYVFLDKEGNKTDKKIDEIAKEYQGKDIALANAEIKENYKYVNIYNISSDEKNDSKEIDYSKIPGAVKEFKDDVFVVEKYVNGNTDGEIVEILDYSEFNNAKTIKVSVGLGIDINSLCGKVYKENEEIEKLKETFNVTAEPSELQDNWIIEKAEFDKDNLYKGAEIKFILCEPSESKKDEPTEGTKTSSQTSPTDITDKDNGTNNNKVVVPSIKNLTKSQAKEKLGADLNLHVSGYTVTDDDNKIGTIYSQSLTAGEVVDKGSTVNCTIYKKKPNESTLEGMKSSGYYVDAVIKALTDDKVERRDISVFKDDTPVTDYDNLKMNDYKIVDEYKIKIEATN